MKDESILDSAGPVFIITAVLAVVVFSGWLMLRGQGGHWGETMPASGEHTTVASH
jgi:hypothetical protein